MEHDTTSSRTAPWGLVGLALVLGFGALLGAAWLANVTPDTEWMSQQEPGFQDPAPPGGDPAPRDG